MSGAAGGTHRQRLRFSHIEGHRFGLSAHGGSRGGLVPLAATSSLPAEFPTLRRTDSRMVRPWLTSPAAISPRPSAPLSTLTLAPAKPPAASLTICGEWLITIWSSATRLLDEAASA